jgi:predicted deacetylase
MSRARYLVRFDDVCPTMNWDVWAKVEALLIERRIKPILAVVPNNQDPLLMTGPSQADFWARVRGWQKLGWTIALHGYEHRYVSANPGLIGINTRSEFAGLPRHLQLEKLKSGLAIFKDNGVTADAWVAPGHSFDAVTVALLVELGVQVISDGYFFRPVKALGVTWVPQQLWRFRLLPAGVWTVCYHANNFLQTDIDRLAGHLSQFSSRLTSVSELLLVNSPKHINLVDATFSWLWRLAIRSKRLLGW